MSSEQERIEALWRIELSSSIDVDEVGHLLRELGDLGSVAAIPALLPWALGE